MSNWTEDRESALTSAVGNETPVTQDTVAVVAEQLEVSPRSVSAKLRKMGFEVEKVGNRQKTFSDEEAEALAAFVDENQDEYTYAEIAGNFAGGKFNARQIQGKILSMELTSLVKPTPKKESVKTYTDAEEQTFIKLAASGAFLEDIADALSRTLPSVRGKALSLSRTGLIAEIPKQRESHAKVKVDALESLGDISEMTVEQIAEAIEKTPRGIKVMLTHRGLECANYKGKKKVA